MLWRWFWGPTIASGIKNPVMFHCLYCRPWTFKRLCSGTSNPQICNFRTTYVDFYFLTNHIFPSKTIPMFIWTRRLNHLLKFHQSFLSYLVEVFHQEINFFLALWELMPSWWLQEYCQWEMPVWYPPQLSGHPHMPIKLEMTTSWTFKILPMWGILVNEERARKLQQKGKMDISKRFSMKRIKALKKKKNDSMRAGVIFFFN